MNGIAYHRNTSAHLLKRSLEHNAIIVNLEDDALIDKHTHFMLQVVFFVILSLSLGLMGTIGNVINTIVFLKQGIFSAGSTVSLFFLALADLGVTFFNFLQSIGFVVILADIPNLPVDPFAIVYLSFGWPLSMLIVVNRMITAYVAFERCMCVVIPFHVQSLFTPRRSFKNLLVIFAYGFISHVPVYFTEKLEYDDQSGTNATKLVLVFSRNREFWHNLVLYLNNFAISFLSAFTVLISTVVTVAYVKTSKNWRKTMSSANSQSKLDTSRSMRDVECSQGASLNLSPQKIDDDHKGTKSRPDKEARLVKMITTISVIFCLCYVPELTWLVVRTTDDRMRTQGQYGRLTDIMWAISFVFSTTNSSLNIFVYYKMSSNYRKEFLTWCQRRNV